jgi:NhaP-type Na+/H+ or K+/H+ antiporter
MGYLGEPMTAAVISVSLLFFVGHGLQWFFRRTKIPDLLILVLFGYVIGPQMGLITAADFGAVGAFVSTLALVVILYEGGLHLSAADLKTSTLPATALSLLGFLLIATTGTLAAWAFTNQAWHLAILMGLAVGSTSSAIVIPMVKALSIQDKCKTVLSLESAFTDVLAIVIFLVFLDGVLAGEFSARQILIGIGPKTLVAILMGISSGLFWSWLRHHGDFSRTPFAGEAWALLSFGLIELSGHNGAMGALALGFTLANINLLPKWSQKIFEQQPVSVSELSLLREITFLLKTFFFIYLGTLVQFKDWRLVLFSLLVCVLIFLTRYLSVRLIYRPQHFTRLDAMITVAMGPRGLACAVLATIPLQRGLDGGEWLQYVLFAIIPMTILFTAILVALSEKSFFRNWTGRLFSQYP